VLVQPGIGGLVMGIAAVIGIIACFLPLVSFSVSAFGINQSATGGMPIKDWRGTIGFLCYLAAVGITIGFLVGNRSLFKGLCWGAIGVGALAVLMAILLLVATMSSAQTSVSGGLPGFNLGVSGGSSPAIGAILNLLAAIGVGVGAVLKARQERLF
jgi:hypothetical protein